MMGIRQEFEQAQFTKQEKTDLAARLTQAAEQEENMTDAAKRKVRKLSRGMIVGIAAACVLTTGALAAALSPGFRSYFTTDTPGAPEALESGIYRLDQSQTYKGWTVTLAECVGDDNGVYIWVDVNAPEGTVLAGPEHGTISTKYSIALPEGMSGHCGGGVCALPDENPGDNKVSFCLSNMPVYGGTLQGEEVTITLDPILDMWWENPGTDHAVRHEGALTAAIRDHKWVFEDVKLDYPNQTVRLTPNVEVPYAGGTATLTKVEISPLGTIVRVEGGSCYDHHGLKDRMEAGIDTDKESGVVISGGGMTITMDVPKPGEADTTEQFQCMEALDVQLNMADGTTLVPPKTGGSGDCEDGAGPLDANKTPYVERRFQYMESSNLIPPRAIDPSQVKSVTVCGVEIPVE